MVKNTSLLIIPLLILLQQTNAVTTNDYQNCFAQVPYPGQCNFSAAQTDCSDWENAWSSQQSHWIWDSDTIQSFQKCIQGYLENNDSSECLEYYEQQLDCGMSGQSNEIIDENNQGGNKGNFNQIIRFALVALFLVLAVIV
ncbi:hypothetical protein PPERSA_05320 [Pseudocohnilembus persalinus]|uniref:Transmembrane protein n=1 Tax=Pseudocohnilembus persalinus TaxID=266149 RepID=A0A0V0R6Z1_PSEPJ|nr:hypothetical protein PPERSA_05320 [Pseudocohnilembus persalinus]|eukprot:KRX09928.1 hypothetical protein PPERSA_05320 [Pseudocohnilembus persalinus]